MLHTKYQGSMPCGLKQEDRLAHLSHSPKVGFCDQRMSVVRYPASLNNLLNHLCLPQLQGGISSTLTEVIIGLSSIKDSLPNSGCHCNQNEKFKKNLVQNHKA